jgi:hypothetical protein
MAANRQNVNIELAEGIRDQLEAVRRWNGMTQKEMVGRLATWFCQQDRMLQQVILGQVPAEYAPDVSRLILERLGRARADAPQLMAEIPEAQHAPAAPAATHSR